MVSALGELREILSKLLEALSRNRPFVNNQNAKVSVPLREI
jgi:hypothetical protein